MRVALFIDGKNFYSGLKLQAADYVLDFTKLAQWLVKHVGGSHLWGAYYYTGVETSRLGSATEGQGRLLSFLGMLEMQPGYFVKRLPRKTVSTTCRQCNAETEFSIEKEIDTTIVADMLSLAAVNAYDVAILLSGDSDLTPAVTGVRSIGKQCYVATWGNACLSAHLRKSAFDHVNLLEGLAEFGTVTEVVDGDYRPATLDANGEFVEPTPAEDPSHVMLRAIKAAVAKFSGGFLGESYFLTRWIYTGLPADFNVRKATLQTLVEAGLVERYHVDMTPALRLATEDGHGPQL